MSDRTLQARHHRARAGAPDDVRAAVGEECRAAGHEISASMWVARGGLRKVHTCTCGAYHEPCGGRDCMCCGGAIS